MKTRRRYLLTPLVVSTTLAVGIVLGILASTLQAESPAAAPTKKIEIVIKDGESKVLSGYIITGTPTEIIVRNEDTITHGFNSSLFGSNDKIELVSGGFIAEGRGPNVFRVGPGKTLALKYTKDSQAGGDNTTYAFWCDMHRSLKGEMLVVELTGEGGG